MSSISTTSTPEPIVSTTASTTTSTTTTTTTTELPTTTNSVEHSIPILNRLDGDVRRSDAPSQSSRVPEVNRRNDVASTWNSQPFSDALIQQYIANLIATPHMVHVVPCMCPMAMAIPSLASLPDSGPSSRSDDILDAESESMDGVIDDQSVVNKFTE